MRKIIPFLLVVTACTSLQSTPETRARVKSAPDWYLDRPTSNSYIYGVATAESQDMNFAIEMAQSMARADIGRQMDIRFTELQKRFQDQTRVTDGSEMLQQFTTAYKQVISQTLTGVRIKSQNVIPGNGVYVVYSMMEMPIGDANRAFIENLRRTEALYTRFRASEMYQELDNEVRRLDSLRTTPLILPIPR
jgi:hypothetical protein